MAGFQKAIKSEAKLRLALLGPAGAGKTYTALQLAKSLVPGGRIALVDTEHGSASKYADLFDFDKLELTSFDPDNYVNAIHDAENAGYDVLILDSLSHAWSGKDGLLEFVDKTARRDAKQGAAPNSYSAWGKATPKHNALIEAMLSSALHLIVTMRVKMEHVQEKDERGKTVIRKVGLQPVQRDGLEYEFDIVGDLDQDNVLTVTKTRCPALKGQEYEQPGEKVAAIIAKWLKGAPVATSTATTQATTPPLQQQSQPPTNGHGKQAETATPAQAADAAFNALTSATEERAQQPQADIPPASAGQISALGMLCKEMYRQPEDLEQLRVWMKNTYGVASRKDLNRDQAADMLKYLHRLQNGAAE